MGDKNRPRVPTKDDVRAYLLDHPDAMGKQVQHEFPSLSLEEARRWSSQIKQERAQSIKAPEVVKVAPDPKPRGPAGAVPAIQLREEDRNVLTETVRDIHATLRIYAARLLKEAKAAEESKDSAGLNKDETQALSQLQKVASGLVDSYPGLMALTEEKSDAKTSGTLQAEDEETVLAVLYRHTKGGANGPDS